jgi:Peptidase family M48
MAQTRAISAFGETVMVKKTKIWVLFLGIISVFVFPAFADRTNLVPAWNLFSAQQDIQMGRILADDLEGRLQVVTDPDSNAYIDALGKLLSAHAAGNPYPYQFRIVNDNTVNLWALPGGFIYVTSGLIESAQNEPQLAGALAHAIGHVVLRHGTAEVSRAYNNDSRATRRVSVDDVMADLNIRFERGALPLHYSTQAERQADTMAAQIMYDSGFDPRQVTQFYAAVANDRTSRTADFFDDHPAFPNRAANVRTEMQKLGGLPQNVRGDSGDFHTVKDRLLAENSNTLPSIRDRNVRGNSADLPSSRMVVYRGRDIEFRYPDNWRVVENGDSISVAPDAGFVSGSLAYGMTIATFDPQGDRYLGQNSFTVPGTRADSTTLANATNQLIDYLRQTNPNIRMARITGRTRVDDAEAMVVDLTNDSPLGGNETDWLVAVLRPNGLLRYFVGVAPQRDFNDYRPAFDRILASVRFLD